VGETEKAPLLLASTFGDDTGGGLFCLDDGELEQLDRLSSTGLAVADGGLARLLRSPAELGYGSELLLYDERGIKRYLRVDELADPHDVLFADDGFVVVATSSNSILWLSESGEVVRRWKASGAGDAWHINSLALDDGRLIACAFGRFAAHRQWAFEETRGKGFIFDVDAGVERIGGLWCPHDPHPIDGGWIICNSAGREVVELDENGRLARRLELRGWARGLAVADDLLFAGESASRKADGAYGDAAGIVVVDRRSWQVVERVRVPSREIYDLVLAPPALVDGVRSGFRTNPLRVAESDQADLFAEAGVRPVRLWATGEPLLPEACRVGIEADVPDELPADSVLALDCLLENRGPAILVSAPPNPVHLSYRWLPAASEGLRSLLPEAIPPASSRSCRLTLQTPPRPGKYTLVITLVQEQVSWFDELDERNALVRPVRVV